MRRLRIIIALLLSVTFMTMSAGEKKEKNSREKERIEKEGRMFAKSLKLSGDSAKKFSKIYVDYKLEIIKALDRNRKEVVDHQRVRGKQLTDKEIDSNIKARFKLSHQLLDIREKYYSRFRQVLSPGRYEQFTIFEQRFDNRKVREHERRVRNQDSHGCPYLDGPFDKNRNLSRPEDRKRDNRDK